MDGNPDNGRAESAAGGERTQQGRVLGPRSVRLEVLCNLDTGYVELNGPIDSRATMDYLLNEARRICEAHWTAGRRGGLLVSGPPFAR